MTPIPNAAAPELDELTVTIVVDNATDTLSSIAPGVPQVPEIAYLFGSVPPTGRHDGHDCVVAFDPDWDALDELQIKLLERWCADKAGGLIVVAGPVYTPQWSSRRRGDPKIDPVKSLYPVAFYSQAAAATGLPNGSLSMPWSPSRRSDGISPTRPSRAARPSRAPKAAATGVGQRVAPTPTTNG